MSAAPTIQTIDCEHCGTPFRPRGEERFCCHGCQYVSQILHDGGLERFYELKGADSLPPVGSKVFQTQDLEWMDTLQKEVESTTESDRVRAEFSIEGISCIGCVWLIEAIYKQAPGALDITILPRENRIRLHWQKGVCQLSEFAQSLQKTGYQLRPAQTQENQSHRESHQLISRIGICGFFLLNTMLFTLPGYLGMGGDFFLAPLFHLLGALFATLSLLVGGGYFIQRAVQAIQRRVLHIDLPIALGLVAAYAGSMLGWATGYGKLIYFDFVASFVFLMLLGRWLQELALERNRSHLKKANYGPEAVTRVGGPNDGARIPVESIEAGDVYTVAPRAINPVAADLKETAASLSLEWINGEAVPVSWKPEQILPAGAINVGVKSIQCQARESWNDSLLAQLLEAPEDHFQNQRLQWILKVYISAVLVIAFAGALTWWLLAGESLKAIQVLISVLVVSCPCALGIALPMCDEFAIARLRRAGLFVKSGEIWERLRRVQTVVFDKTGTLTMDIPRLANPEAIRDLDPFATEALSHLVEHNAHPVARSIREALLAQKPLHSRHADTEPAIEETIGQGVAWIDSAGNEWTLGKPSWALQTDAPEQTAHAVLAQNACLVASFVLEEDVRDDAAKAFAFFKAHRMETAILSGDRPERVQSIAHALSLSKENIRAQCRPQDKAEWIQNHAPGQALMIGDGANDRLAFDQAICRGTPVVDRSILEASADFFFFGRSLQCLPMLWQIAQKRRRTVTLIFAVAVTYNLTAVGICLSGHMHPLLAAILMPLSSIVTLAISWWGLGASSKFSN